MPFVAGGLLASIAAGCPELCSVGWRVSWRGRRLLGWRVNATRFILLLGVLGLAFCRGWLRIGRALR
jgi:hypothetical protein